MGNNHVTGTTPTRVLGALTAGYGVTIIGWPVVLARPCGMTSADGTVTPSTRTSIRGIGARDAAIGAAMLFAPAGPALRTALAARVFADTADAVIFGSTLVERGARMKVATFAVGWALLCAGSSLLWRSR